MSSYGIEDQSLSDARDELDNLMEEQKMESRNRIRTSMEEGLGGMKKLETPEPATKKKRILLHKWKTSKKSSLGARNLDMFHAFHLFCLWQAFLMQILTFSSILRVLSRNYDMKKSSENLNADGLEDSIDLGKWSTLLTHVQISPSAKWNTNNRPSLCGGS
ncbi:hypothetical protein DH2020_029103 [Rehmannia glutinosa]|uniref:Uncharacterized protein n=1 Tax=Rehmannia glutinosa TaxID=99300 RepID=A0ABR0VPK2_REHGL